MKKKPLKIIIIIITAILLLISAFFITRLFESKEDKALREMNVIVREYMPAKIGDIVDFVQSFDPDLYKIDGSFFSDFTNLEHLNIDFIETEATKEFLDKALEGLPETCTDINTEVRRSYSGE